MNKSKCWGRLWLIIVLLLSVGALLSPIARAQTALPGTESCAEAEIISANSGSDTGELSRKFVDCYSELLAVMGVLMRNALADQPAKLAVLTPFLDVFNSIATEIGPVLHNDVLGVATQQELDDFEFVLRNVTLLEEISAVRTFLDTPSQSFPDAKDKLGVLSILIDSAGDLIKKAFDIIDENFKVIVLLIGQQIRNLAEIPAIAKNLF